MLPFAFGMVVPPFLGQEFLAGTPDLVDAKGYVPVRDTYQSQACDEYAVGVAAAVEVPWQTPTPVGIPETGYPTETRAHVAARNIANRPAGVERRVRAFATAA